MGGAGGQHLVMQQLGRAQHTAPFQSPRLPKAGDSLQQSWYDHSAHSMSACTHSVLPNPTCCQKDAISSSTNSRPPMGAEKATATPIAAPAVTKSRLSLGFCGEQERKISGNSYRQ